MSSKRRVLVVSPDLPFPPSWGFGTRVYQLIRCMARDYDVTVLSYARPGQEPDIEELRRVAEVVVVTRVEPSVPRRRLRQVRSLLAPLPYHAAALLTSEMQDAIDQCLSLPFDLVQIESSQMAAFRFHTTAPLVLDEHNIESELLQRLEQGETARARRLFNRLEAAKYTRLEDKAWGRFAACVTTSAREQDLLQQRAPHLRVAVVPNGVDPEHFSPGSRPQRGESLVFTGLLSYRPNLDAVRWFIEAVLPLIHQRRPDVTFTVVGTGAKEDLVTLTGNGVTATGWVPDVRPYMERAAVVVVPIRMGSGTRLKVVEALSMMRPVVSTSVGCEGIDVTDGRHLLVADEPASFASAVCRLLEDSTLAAELAKCGHDLVRDQYSWDRSGQLLAALHRLVLRQATSPRAAEAPP